MTEEDKKGFQSLGVLIYRKSQLAIGFNNNSGW
jgi:hypothetical protein